MFSTFSSIGKNGVFAFSDKVLPKKNQIIFLSSNQSNNMDSLSTSEKQYIEWVKQLGQERVVSRLDTADSMRYFFVE